jgi:hypothetical protein
MGLWYSFGSVEKQVHASDHVRGVKDMKTFKDEWILEPFREHPTFFSKSMFGGLAVYLYERQMLLLVEPTKSGRWNWHGVLVCTDFGHHKSIQAKFPALKPHDFLRKWLFIDSAHQDFESTMEGVANRVASNDPRFGILPKSPRRGGGKQAREHG